MPRARHARAASIAYSLNTTGSLYVNALLAQPSLAAAAARSSGLGCASMAFTYNDPVVFMEYDRIIVRERHARAAEPRGGGSQILGACAVSQRVHLARLRHIPVLTI